MTRPTPADVEFEFPDCPVCYKMLDGDGDGLSCNDCRANWNPDGSGGRWDDETGEQCPSVGSPAWSHRRCRCILTTGHRSWHQSGGGDDWRDGPKVSS